MRGRRRSAVAGFVVVLAVWLGTASAAWGYYTVTPRCTSAAQTSTCGSGWYTSNVSLSWTWSPMDGGNPTSGCAPQFYLQDTSTMVSCTVQGPSGGGSATQPIHVETSTPTVAAVPARPPDSTGWYNHPVAASIQGSSFSGITSCTATTYAGPETPNATVGGSCTDNAGKTSNATSPTFPYDATPPAVHVAAHPGDAMVVLHWAAADVAPLASIKIVRAPGLRRSAASIVYRGHGAAYRDARVRDGVSYRYTLVVRDQAGNVARRSLVVTPGPLLLAPDRGGLVSIAPLLVWTPVRGATYYDVQLYRGGRKVLSSWPTRARLQLTPTWSFDGRRYQLRAGRYRWYVWPGFGPRAAARYGPAIGSRTFVVTRLI